MGSVETREDKFKRLMEFRDSHLSEIRDMYYWHVRRDSKGLHEPRWRGHILWKYPSDIVLYAQAIFANKPDFIIEAGTAWGGSAVFFGDMLSLINAPGKVISIDVDPRRTPDHPKVEYITGSTTDPDVVKRVRQMVSGGSVMASLDSDHRERHVRRELRYYSGIVTVGQYIVVEDCHVWADVPYAPGRAVEWFLGRTDRYVREDVEWQYLVAISRGGWLKRVR